MIAQYTRKALWLISLGLLLVACVRPTTEEKNWKARSGTSASLQATSSVLATPTRTPLYFATRDPDLPRYTPTPDAPHPLPTLRKDPETYVVRRGDTLGTIAQRYGISIQSIVEANQIINPDLLSVGQVLTIPAPQPLPPGPSYKIIPDSELVNSPAAAFFDTRNFVDGIDNYLSNLREEVEGITLTGAQIVDRVSREYSVNPRLLLAILEYQSGWVTLRTPPEKTLDYPMGYLHPSYKGLYRQLSWAANNLNQGYYLWKSGGIAAWILSDGAVVPPNATINAGTAGIQHFFSILYDQPGWFTAVSENGLAATYQRLFGYPFDYAVEPLIPTDLTQPSMQLPFEAGTIWSFTGGPHGGWGSGSAWAALDFAPPGEALGCVLSDAWVVAVADGLIVRAENGAVVQDLDSDGLEQTGWSVLYMHIEARDRVQPGTRLRAGERIGHPSCEGGYSTGTHVHLARRYNGEWIPADTHLPFVLDGWVSSGDGIEYDGWLTRDGQIVEAWEGRKAENQIYR